MRQHALVVYKEDAHGERPFPSIEEFDVIDNAVDVSRCERRRDIERIVTVDGGPYLEELFGLEEASALIRDLAREILKQSGMNREVADKLVMYLALPGREMHTVVKALGPICHGLGYPKVSQFRLIGIEGEVYGQLVAAMKKAGCGAGTNIRTRSGDVAGFELGSNDPNRLVFSIGGYHEHQMDAMDILLWLKKEYPELVEEILGVVIPK